MSRPTVTPPMPMETTLLAPKRALSLGVIGDTATMIGAIGKRRRAALSGVYLRINWKYCVMRNITPNMDRKIRIMPLVPVLKDPPDPAQPGTYSGKAIVDTVARGNYVGMFGLGEICAAVGLDAPAGEITRETAETVARAARQQTGATHALAVLIDLDEGADRIEFGGTICLAIATVDDTASRRSRIVGGREWVRLGAVEMALDCLRRFLQSLPVWERTDFEKVEKVDGGAR